MDLDSAQLLAMSKLWRWPTGAKRAFGGPEVSRARFDWIAIDSEHAPDDITTLLLQLGAMRGGVGVPKSTTPGIFCLSRDAES
jgi:hypothetical protein